MQKFLSLVAVAALATSAFAGAVISEDFNGGVFTQATTTMPYTEIFQADGVTHDRYEYTANATATFDNWVAYEDFGTANPIDLETIRLDGWLGTITPNGNNMPGWTTADGNVGGFYQKYNDVPKTGWGTSAVLDASMGGARNAAGDALAFTLIYDAECAWIHYSRGAYTRVNAKLTLNGTSYNANSPAFYAAANVIDAAALAAAGGLDITSLPTATLLDTSDSVSGVTATGAAIRGVTSGVIEQAVPNGSAIDVLLLNNRTSNQGISSWQYIAAGADNVKVVALEAGDTDGDLDVDGTDIVNLNAGNAFNNGNPATWASGDFTGDGLFNGSDVIAINGAALFGTGPYAATTPGADGDGVVSFVYDAADGSLVIDTDGALLSGFQILSAAGNLTGAATLPMAMFTVNSATELNGGLGATYADGTSLGLAVAPGLSEADLLADLTMVATISGQSGIFDADLIYVPEPATMSLLVLGGLAAVIRRRK